MGLSRRALFPAAAGGFLAGPEAARAVMQQAEQGVQAVQAPTVKLASYRQELLDQKARCERWMRGEFGPDELTDHRNTDPRSPPYDHRGHEIAALKSVSAGHKMRMMEDAAQRRYVEHRKLQAGRDLLRVLKNLAGLP